jgi:hypothetical protein
VTLIRRTKNITHYTVVENRVVNRGIGVEVFEKEVGRPVERYRVRDVDSIRVSRGGKVRGEEVELFRPAISKRRDQREPAERRGAMPGARPRAARPEAAPPEGEAGPPPPDIRRQERKSRQLESYHAAEQEELERIHRDEVGNPPRGESQDEIVRRQDAEHRAQELKQQRERQVFQQRQRRETETRSVPAPTSERRAKPAPGPSAAPRAGPSAKPRSEPAAKPKPEPSAKPKAEKEGKPKPGKPGGD